MQGANLQFLVQIWETIEYDKNGVIVGKIVNGVKTIENSRQVTPELEVDAAV